MNGYLKVSTVTVLMALSLAGCATPTTPRPAPPTPARWVIDHLDGVEDATNVPVTATYTAYCASTDMYTPVSVPDDSDFTAVAITQADFLRLNVGDPCPLPTADIGDGGT